MVRPRPFALTGILTSILCGPAGGQNEIAAPALPAVTYVHKIDGITDFTGYGQYGYYFPLFGRTVWDDEHKTDSDMVFFNPVNFGWEFDIRDGKRTFSPDAGPFGDCCNSKRIGVYTAGGDTRWDFLILPNGQAGYAGTTVDEAARNNTNQSINRIEIQAETPSSFCLRILQDSTNFEFESDEFVTARARAGGADYSASIPSADHIYDGHTDMYTFRYENLNVGDYIKIKFRGIDKDPGFSGILFDPVEACPDPPIAVVSLQSDQGTYQLSEGETQTLPLARDSAAAVAAGDFDGNGIPDYVLSWGGPKPGGYSQQLYMNGRRWVDLHPEPALAYAVGDLDGNGQDDIVVDFGPGTSLSVWANQSAWREIHSGRADVLEVMDLDGNARQELVANFPGLVNPLKVYWNNLSWTDLGSHSVTGLAAEQINGSGVEDLVAAFPTGLWVYTDNEAWRPIHAARPHLAAAADLNGNGQAEVIATWSDAECGTSCGTQILYDNGEAGDWLPLDPRTANALTGGDMDGNARGDLLVSWAGGGPISAYLNDALWTDLSTALAPAASMAVREFTCGDHLCQAGETSCDCPQDCAVATGDGCCDRGESSCTEPACPLVQGDGCCDYGAHESCGSPDCICPEVVMGEWAGFSPEVYHHPAPAGVNRLLVFVAHGVRGGGMHVDDVQYGGQRMTKILQQQEHHNRHALVAIFYLGEAGIARAERLNRADFFVDWNGAPDPDRRRYESVFFFNADRAYPVEQFSSVGHSNDNYIETSLGFVEAGHVSLYATTHEECVEWFPVRDYIDFDQACGSRSSSFSVAHKVGVQTHEVPGAWATSSDAIVLGALEVNRYGKFVPEPSAAAHAGAALMALWCLSRRCGPSHWWSSGVARFCSSVARGAQAKDLLPQDPGPR